MDAEPAAIIDQIEALDEIQQDLAETAQAVEATEEAAVVDNANDMEDVLEQSIPDAPASLPSAVEETMESAAVQADSVDAVLPATDATTLPSENGPSSSTLEPAAEPVNGEAPVIEDTGAAEENTPITIDQPPSIEVENQAAALTTIPPLSAAEATAFPTAPPTPVIAAPIPISATAAQPLPVAPVEEVVHSVPLPEGLNENSPTVVGNPSLIRQWRADPKNSLLVLALFTFAVSRTEINDARVWYELLAVDNPTATEPLLALINLELALSNFPQVEALFGRVLRSGGASVAADVNIWKSYLHYIRRQNPITEGAPNVEQVRTTVGKAYEFALNECGTDRESGEIWQEYITYLSEAQPKTTWDIQKQSDDLRIVYHKAICIPLNNIEELWKSYNAFENGINKPAAKKFLGERSAAYMTARTTLRELRQLTDVLPHPVIPATPNFSDADRAAVAGWKAYIKWEESNPLSIEDETILKARVDYALRKCIGEMRNYPEIWYFVYQTTLGRSEAGAYLKAGVEACPKSFLLTFAYADAQEDLKNFSECHTTYNALLDRLSPEIDELKIFVEKEIEAAKGPEITAIDPSGDSDMHTAISRLIQEREERGRVVAEMKGREVQEKMVAYSIVWIMYLRFARRAEGTKTARLVFSKARKSPLITWHTFEAAAMLEYHSNKDSVVAIRIFEFGLKLFAEDTEYVVHYLNFLLSVNDDTNARALFERSALKIPAEKARPLWDAWARYEYSYGDLNGIHKLEARFAETFPNDPPLKRFAQRFTYNNIDEIAIQDLGFGQRRSFVPPPMLPQQPQPPFQPPQLAAVPQPAPTLPVQHSIPPPPPHLAQAPIEASPQKREYQEFSPARSVDPPNKRFRQASPPPPPRRQPLPPPPVIARYRDRSPPPHVAARERERDYPPVARREERPPQPPVPVREALDRSGVSKALAWFIGGLPKARAFDGPIFRAEDIMGLFSNISATGAGIPAGPPPGRSAYPDARYRGAAPPARRY